MSEQHLIEVHVGADGKGGVEMPTMAKKRKTKKDKEPNESKAETTSKDKSKKAKKEPIDQVPLEEDDLDGDEEADEQQKLMYGPQVDAGPSEPTPRMFPLSLHKACSDLTKCAILSIVYCVTHLMCSIRKLNAFAKVPENIENDTRLVLMQFYLLKLEHISTTDQTCMVDFGISMWWKSPEIVGKYGDDWDYNNEVKFWPELEFDGDIKHHALLENHGSVWINGCFTKHGIMNNYQRWKVLLHIPMKLQEFPFDQQIIRLRIASWAWSKSSMQVESITRDESRYAMTEKLHSLVEWKPTEMISIRQHDVWDSGDERWMSSLTVYIPLRRVYGFYLNNIISMGFLISLIGIAVLFVTPSDVGERLELSITLLLAAIAFAFVTAEYLPKVSYSNYMSEFFVMVYSFMGIEVVESVVANLIVRFKGKGDVDKAYAAIILDWTSIAVLFAAHILYLLRILYVAKWRHRAPPDYEAEPNETCCHGCSCGGAPTTKKILKDKKWD